MSAESLPVVSQPSPGARALPATGSDVRVRFCPSPTGTPHVGLIRTALFNWAYARHVGGTFVFRIEDTDAERDSEDSYRQVLDALRWLGLDWDEGVEVGGPHGPYRQSQRGDIYQDVIARLVDGGYAYESFSTPEETEARNVAAGRSKVMGYDGFDRDLTDEQKAEFRAQGREPVLRLRMPDEDVTFTDLVRGDVTFKAGTVPDYVIVRANGQPLYTLVNPVDDALMEITHVLRGEDLLSSTPRQVVLYQALLELGVAKVVPAFGHLPYVMGEGNKKLSKRDPASNLFLHRERGFVPRASSTIWRSSGGASLRTTTSSPSTRWSPRSTSLTSCPTLRASTSRRPRRSTLRTCVCSAARTSATGSCRTCTPVECSRQPRTRISTTRTAVCSTRVLRSSRSA